MEIGLGHVEIYASRHFAVRAGIAATAEESIAIRSGAAVLEGYGVGYVESTETGKYIKS